jgi:hypothetical protein
MLDRHEERLHPKIEKLRKTGSLCLFMSLAILSTGSALAESVERNPFLPPPPELRIEAAERDRVLAITSDVVRTEMTRLERSVTETVERRLIDRLDRQMQTYTDAVDETTETRAAMIEGSFETLKAEIPEMIETAISEQKSVAGIGATGSIPEGAVFVACVNRKALYRDQTGNTFYSDDNDATPGAADCSN